MSERELEYVCERKGEIESVKRWSVCVCEREREREKVVGRVCEREISLLKERVCFRE